MPQTLHLVFPVVQTQALLCALVLLYHPSFHCCASGKQIIKRHVYVVELLLPPQARLHICLRAHAYCQLLRNLGEHLTRNRYAVVILSSHLSVSAMCTKLPVADGPPRRGVSKDRCDCRRRKSFENLFSSFGDDDSPQGRPHSPDGHAYLSSLHGTIDDDRNRCILAAAHHCVDHESRVGLHTGPLSLGTLAILLEPTAAFLVDCRMVTHINTICPMQVHKLIPA